MSRKASLYVACRAVRRQLCSAYFAVEVGNGMNQWCVDIVQCWCVTVEWRNVVFRVRQLSCLRSIFLSCRSSEKVRILHRSWKMPNYQMLSMSLPMTSVYRFV